MRCAGFQGAAFAFVASVAALAAVASSSSCAPSTVTVSVNQPPVPVLDMPATAKVGELVHIDASKTTDLDGAVSDAFILFGDGSDPAVVSATLATDHKFAAPGLYLVELYVDDNKHATARARLRVQVTP